MYDLTLNMQSALQMRTAQNLVVHREPVILYEIYPSDYYPPLGGQFDPADAVKRYSEVERSWLGLDYDRLVTEKSDIGKHIGSEFNGCNVTFTNIGEDGAKPMSAFVLGNNISRMRLVVRYTDRSKSVSLEDSVIMYVGRLEPADAVSSDNAVLTSKETLGSSEHQVPRRHFSKDDEFGRSPNDPEFEGIRSVANRGTGYYDATVPKKFLGITIGSKTERRSRQWSSENDAHEGETMPYIDGRCQMELIPIVWQDEGYIIITIYVGAGHKIWDWTDVQVHTEGYRFQAAGPISLGDPGGTGTNAVISARFAAVGYLSRTAYQEIAWITAPNEVQDPAPVTSAILFGECDLPDGAGGFTVKGPSDNPVLIARRKLVDADFFGLHPNEINDEQTLVTAALAEQFIRDVTNSETLVASEPVAEAITSGQITRYRSTALVQPSYFRWLDDPIGNPYPSLEPIPFPDGDPGGYPLDAPIPPIAPVVRYRRRFTYNAPLTDDMKAIDFLRNHIYSSSRLWDKVGQDGRISIMMDQPADSAYLTEDAALGETEVEVTDARSWIESKKGEVLIGAGLITSDARTVVDAAYSDRGNDITIDVESSGSAAADFSGSGTLFGGTPTVPASARITVSSPGNEGDQLVAVIDGIKAPYTMAGDEDGWEAAQMLAVAINTDLELRQYVVAVPDPDLPIVDVYSKLGTLTLDRPLDFDHQHQLPSPTAPPAANPSFPGSTLVAGSYWVAYSWQSAVGETLVSPPSMVTVLAGRRIALGALVMPFGASSVNWYMSKAAGDHELAFLTNRVTGDAFTVSALPLIGARGVPQINDAGEETIRILFNFTAENIRSRFEWPLSKSAESTNQILIKYKSAIDGWADKEYRANDYLHQREFGRTNTKEIIGVGIDSHDQAVRLANAELAKLRDGNFMVRWDTDEAGIVYEVGDVGCVTDDSGLTRQPVRIEDLRILGNNDVEFTSRVYSTHQMRDLTGVKQVSISSPLKYLAQAPPDVENVTLSESHLVSAGNTWVSMIVGEFDFGEYLGGQVAHVYVKYEGEGSYHVVDNIRPDPDGHGRFEVVGPPRTTPGNGHKLKLVTESTFGRTNGLALATEYTVFVNGPPALVAPSTLQVFFEASDDGDGLVDWAAGASQVDSASQEVHELEVRDLADTTTLRGPIRVAPSELTSLQEYIIWNSPPGVTLVGEGGFDLGMGQPDGGAMVESQSGIEVVGGALVEFEAPSVADPLFQSMCEYVSIFPTSSYGYSSEFAFMWQFVDRSGPPEYNAIQPWWAYPEGFSGGDHDAFRRPLMAGAKYGVYLRPDGVAEYHINYVPGAAPVFISARPVIQSELYRAFGSSVGGPGGVRHARWRRQGPEWKFIGRAQRLLYSGSEAGALPAQIALRVRQLSPWSNGTHSPWTSGTFTRP
jgi:hypothetical protein